MAPDGGNAPTEPALRDDTSTQFTSGMSGSDVSTLSPLELTRQNRALKEENVKLADAVAARDSFLAVAAHEVLNGLSPLVGRVELLRRKAVGMPMEAVRAELDRISGITAIFARRATTLLDISRITSGVLHLDIARVDVNKIATDVVEGFQVVASLSDAQLSLNLQGQNFVSGDQVAIQQILDNLVSNAIKYGDGAPICVSVATDDRAQRVDIRVQDRGPGISEENQARIFERFERAVRSGSTKAGFGVGLWLVKQLTEAMRGEVALSSFPNQGTTFCISLPLYIEEERE